jgi:hypothetical protein
MSDKAAVNPDQIIGIAICNNCQKRFRFPKKHEALIGKAVRCPACHQSFVVKLGIPSQVEQAAIKNEEQDQSNGEKKTTNRRSKSTIREQYLTRIRERLKTMHKRLAELSENSGSEEQVRVFCIDVLRDVLGYDNGNIDTEVCALGQRIDIALKDDDKIFLIVECKNTRSKLPSNVRDQAVMYSANKSAEWAVASNGAIWKLWRVIPRKGQDPIVVPVFDISLLDEDGISEADISNFYLLTKRALFNGETMSEYHRQEAASDQRILRAMRTERVIAAVKKVLNESYRDEAGERAKLTDDFVASRLETMFLPEEL